MEQVQVSIVCNAYNHEPYIRDALEGFVMQKTTFPFEVLVHDDASTDNTASIIREYEKKYPEIIKPIYETENQYSKKDGSLGRIQYGRVKGKYIALCEGDDYWTDPMKLQKQYDALESHPELDICATGAKTERNGFIDGKIAPVEANTIFSQEEVIQGGGGFVATASLMYRTDIRKNPPSFFKMLALDYCIQILGSLRGGMLYLAEMSCVYRAMNPGSWTARTYSNMNTMDRHQKEICGMLKCLDADTLGKYHNTIDRVIRSKMFGVFYRNRSYKAMCAPEYKEFLQELPASRRMMVRVGKYCPQAVNLALAVRERFR